MYYNLSVSVYQDLGVTDYKEVSNYAANFTCGKYNKEPIDQNFEVEVNFTEKDPPTDYISSYIHLMSNRFIQALKNAGVDNLQTYPITLKNSELGLYWKDYSIVNFVGIMACADLERSVIGNKLFSGYTFKKLVVDVEKANGALLFILEESASGEVLVHYDVAVQMFTKQNKPRFKGPHFNPVKSRHNCT